MDSQDARSAAHSRRWINCPLCGSTDTRAEPEGEDGWLIFCTNLLCPSNVLPDESLAATSVDLRLELDMQRVREWYDEYVADVAFYVAEDSLDPQHPDQGYRTGEPESFEQYAADVLTGVLDDVICAHPGYRVVRA